MKLLIVDDSLMMRRIIRKEFENSEFEIIEAADGIEALAQIEQHKPDLITMDVDMPKMDGFETVKKINADSEKYSKANGEKIPIIFITANDTIDGRSKGFEVGAAEFVTKPFLSGEVSSVAKLLLKPEEFLENRTVLIAEDSRTSRELLNTMIKREGFKTILAENGIEAFELMKSQQNSIDMVITDYIMPEMNGDELCIKIRQDLGNKTVPIIFLSGLTERKYILKIFKSGASDYIVKPFAKEELLARVRVHLKSMAMSRKLSSQVMELKRLSKLKDDFLAITSHDLRAPLNGILGFTDLLLDEEGFTDTQMEYLRHVKDSGDFLLSLINDILDLGKLQSEGGDLEKDVLSLDKIIVSSMNTIHHMASPKNIELKLESKAKNPVYILGNDASLIRVFNNILSNAIKFTPTGGEIRQILELIDDGTKISISIIDNGIGIAADKLPNLFNKYSNVSKSGTAGEKGTGLGMSITKELVERHDGTIHVTSELDKGTCFQLIFPLAQNEENIPKTGTSDEKIAKKGANQKEKADIKILLVDDNQLNLKLAKTVFEKNGYKVECVVDGLEAKKMVSKNVNSSDTKFDLIFMDIQMPVMNGLEATEAIRDLEKEASLEPVCIIAMTAASSESERIASKKAGMDAFITKPINMKEVEKVMKQFIYH
jgi:CheY-like chemotaxis protein/two-component sensor histidine kinase